MTDSEAFAFHFAELDRRGLDGPVPEGWDFDTQGRWTREAHDWSKDHEAQDLTLGVYCIEVEAPERDDLAALTGILTQALADAGNLTIHTTRDGTNTVTTPAFAVHRKPLLAALVTAYWRAQAAPSP